MADLSGFTPPLPQALAPSIHAKELEASLKIISVKIICQPDIVTHILCSRKLIPVVELAYSIRRKTNSGNLENFSEFDLS